MLGNLSEKFEGVMRKLSGQATISEGNVRESMDEVREALLEADVHYEVAEAFCETVLTEALGESVLKSVEPGQQMIKIVHDELVKLLGGEEAMDDEGRPIEREPIMYVQPGPTIIMMSGLQGSGKTTTCGKLAGYMKKRGKNVMLAACDLQRPAAVTQLEVLANQVEQEVEGSGKVMFHGEPEKCAEYGQAVGVAVQVANRALESAKLQGADVLILDTAGRLHVNDELMGELRQVSNAVNPHQIYLVIDAMTGQDAVNSAKAFHAQLELDGVVLTKFDSDTRGGAALTVKKIVGEPIKFIGVGEKLDALEEFHASRIASRILGMGDVVSLVEKAQEQVSEEEALALQEKMEKGKLTMDDFLKQLQAIRKMGSMKSLLGMLPGIGNQLKDLNLDDKQIDRTQAIIQSMTVAERKDVDLLDNSRRRRISKGSGSDAKDVSQLVKGFEMVSQLSKQMSGAGMMSKVKSMAGMGSGAMAGMRGKHGHGMPKMKGSTKHKPTFKQKKRKRK
ncbi:Signal recognition particle protein [Poriferisphaera corsica]|uniref:Signal recognition particle protein n=1 Tax=Poriferisphaera corsica TaxID=2528020 RepID=A0A517YYH1_9BACT|nr:signal recognition particle protein [Poriferisphaera corsica]QDU35274.1 Signal recognition particle protein [Poriferisphaera corsica]